MIKLLLNKDADVTACTSLKWTSLHTATTMNHLRAAKILIDNWGDRAVSSIDDTTSLYAVARDGHEKIVDLLLENGAHLFVLNFMSETAFHVASRSNSPTFIFTLLNLGADSFLLDAYVRTSIGWSMIYGTQKKTLMQLFQTQLPPSASSQSILKNPSQQQFKPFDNLPLSQTTPSTTF